MPRPEGPNKCGIFSLFEVKMRCINTLITFRRLQAKYIMTRNDNTDCVQYFPKITGAMISNYATAHLKIFYLARIPNNIISVEVDTIFKL